MIVIIAIITLPDFERKKVEDPIMDLKHPNKWENLNDGFTAFPQPVKVEPKPGVIYW